MTDWSKRLFEERPTAVAKEREAGAMTRTVGPVAWRTRAEDGIQWLYFSFEGNAIRYREKTGAVVEPLYLRPRPLRSRGFQKRQDVRAT